MDAAQYAQMRAIVERHKTPDAVRSYAFQLWAFECGRNASKVAAELGCQPRTVEKWARREHWQQRADSDFRALMPDLMLQAGDNFRLAALHISRRVLTIAKAADNGIPPNIKEVESLVRMAGLAGFSSGFPLPIPAPGPSPDTSAIRSTADLIAAHHKRLGIADEREPYE